MSNPTRFSIDPERERGADAMACKAGFSPIPPLADLLEMAGCAPSDLERRAWVVATMCDLTADPQVIAARFFQVVDFLGRHHEQDRPSLMMIMEAIPRRQNVPWHALHSRLEFLAALALIVPVAPDEAGGTGTDESQNAPDGAATKQRKGRRP